MLFLLLSVPAVWARGVSCREVLTRGSEPVFKPVPGHLFLAFRSNANHFWAWARGQAPRFFSRRDLQQIGVVTGDPHIGNFGDIKTEHGIRFGLIDLDDAGRGPLLLDGVKLISGLRLQGTSARTEDFVDAYLDGLLKEDFEKPEFLKFNDRDFDFKNNLFKYGEKSQIRGRFDREKRELQPFRSSPAFEEGVQIALAKIRESFPQAELADLGLQVKTTGGSAGLTRIWMLVKIKDSYAVYELKEMAEPATRWISPQLSPQKRLDEVQNSYWKDSSRHFQVVKTSTRDFWMRPRMKDQFDAEELRPSDLKEYMGYLASYLGKKHRQQLDRRQIETWREDRDRLREAIGNMVSASVETIRRMNDPDSFGP